MALSINTDEEWGAVQNLLYYMKREQSQASLQEQLLEVQRLARLYGLYDAADFISTQLQKG